MVTAPGASTRVATDWFSASNFTVELTFTDGLAHNVAFYCLDWDNLSRTQRIDVLDGDTGTLLETRSLSAFSGGIWLVWRLKGHVKLNFANTTNQVKSYLRNPESKLERYNEITRLLS